MFNHKEFQTTFRWICWALCEARRKQEHVNELLYITSSLFLSRNRESVSEKLKTNKVFLNTTWTHNTQCKLSYNKQRPPAHNAVQIKNYTVTENNAPSPGAVCCKPAQKHEAGKLDTEMKLKYLNTSETWNSDTCLGEGAVNVQVFYCSMDRFYTQIENKICSLEFQRHVLRI
jgi:hypothetical protein